MLASTYSDEFINKGKMNDQLIPSRSGRHTISTKTLCEFLIAFSDTLFIALLNCFVRLTFAQLDKFRLNFSDLC